MVTKVYGTTVIPSDQITVRSGGSIGFVAEAQNTAGLVGGMDTSTGTANEGEVVEVPTAQDAATLFGEESELYHQCRLAIQNGARTLWAVGVTESAGSDTFNSVSQGTLDEVPMDPNVHPDHTITETGGNDVNIVYDEPVVAPTASNTINLNPRTKSWKADSSGTYTIEYTYGDYTTATANMVAYEPRFLGVCTEVTEAINEAVTDLTTEEDEFKFMQAIAGAPVDLDAGTYSDSLDEMRLSIVASSRGYIDDALTEEVRTVGAVTGYLASLPLEATATYKSLSGLTGLRQEFTPTQAGSLTDAGVLPLMKIGRQVKIVKDMTTSTDSRFERVYSVGITDEVSELLHTVTQDFIGRLNTPVNRTLYEATVSRALDSMRDDNPPALDGYTLTVTKHDTDPNAITVKLGIDIVNVIDTAYVEIVVGDVILNGGVS